MKIKNSALVAMVVSLGFASAAFAADGTINFTGKITDTACTVSSDSITTPVALGTVSSKAFSGSGTTAAATKFTINIASCPDTVTSASVRFDGTPNTANNKVLAVTGGATNVGIGIYEADSSTLIPLQNNSKAQALVTGTNQLSYIAKYYAVADGVTAGDANATATFTITYQ